MVFMLMLTMLFDSSIGLSLEENKKISCDQVLSKEKDHFKGPLEKLTDKLLWIWVRQQEISTRLCNNKRKVSYFKGPIR